MITIKQLPKEAITRLSEIDRSEKIDLIYKHQAGRLVEVHGNFDSPNWSEEHVQHLIAMCRPHLEESGVLLGALDGETLAGVAVLGSKLFGEKMDRIQLVILFVTRAYRRQGIAARLFDEVVRLATERKATYLYISATESRSAVGFYRSQGCVLAEDVDPELYALEPEDIHFVKRLR